MPVITMPRMKYRCAEKKSTTIGSVIGWTVVAILYLVSPHPLLLLLSLLVAASFTVLMLSHILTFAVRATKALIAPRFEMIKRRPWFLRWLIPLVCTTLGALYLKQEMGWLVSSAETLLAELELRAHVEFLGRYAQREAPGILRRAHALLHTKVKDPCPSLVIEAMACGLPVVYPASGGTPELVGSEAGIGVSHPESWDRDEPPSPEALR